MLHLLYYQGPLRTVCLQQDSDYVCIWPGYHLHYDTASRATSGVVKESFGEWNGTLLPSLMRIGSVFMRVMDIHMYGVDLASIIFWNIFPATHRLYLRLQDVGAISTTCCHIW